MLDLSTVTHEQFEPCTNQSFAIELESSVPMELTLIEVETWGDLDTFPGTRQPFRLLFRGPVTPVLEQQTFVLLNETLGDLSLFLVPVGPDEKGMRYEVVIT